MNQPTSDPVGPSQIQDKRVPPPGVLPRNAQAWVLGIVAFVMVVVIALSGKSAPKSVPPPPPTAVDPNEGRIREYQKRIEEQARKLQLEQARLNHTRQALGVSPGSLDAGDAATPYPPSLGYVRPGELKYPAAEASAEDASIKTEMKKRAYLSLFASNVALSYRKETAGAPTALGSPASALPAMPFYYPTPPAMPPDLMLPVSRTVGSAPAQEERLTQTGPAPSREVAEDREQTIAKTKPETDPALRAADGKLYRLFEGTVLETVLTNRLDGSFSGPVNCMVTTNVYSHNRQHILIPQGSRVLGEVRKVETFGQGRLAVFFHRLIMPDGYSVSLDKFQGLNQIGETGLVDQVNHHYMQVFGVSLAIGAIAGLSQSNTRYGPDESAVDAYRQGVSASLSQSSLRILDRYLNVLPTFTIREGHRVKVYLSNDLLLPGYERHQLPSDL
jgi:type IV secretory pathway VirB10-like protein